MSASKLTPTTSKSSPTDSSNHTTLDLAADDVAALLLHLGYAAFAAELEVKAKAKAKAKDQAAVAAR